MPCPGTPYFVNGLLEFTDLVSFVKPRTHDLYRALAANLRTYSFTQFGNHRLHIQKRSCVTRLHSAASACLCLLQDTGFCEVDFEVFVLCLPQYVPLYQGLDQPPLFMEDRTA